MSLKNKIGIYDLIIIGAGPAGITASIYAARKKMDFFVVTKDIGGQAILSSAIENYTGYQFITGPELSIKFKQHIESFGIQVNEGENVLEVKKENELFKIITDKNTYYSKTTLVCSGRIPRKLNVKGEEEFKYRGVTYCATCDGPLFAGKDVVVVGGGNAGLDAAIQLMKIANKVYILEINPKLNADPVMIEKVQNAKNVDIFTNTKVIEIYGNNFVKGIKIYKNEKEEYINVQGIFVEIGSTAASDFVKDVLKEKNGEIVVNCRCETSIEGLYAAGDVTNVPAKQIIVACGEGAKALISLSDYLNRLKI